MNHLSPVLSALAPVPRLESVSARLEPQLIARIDTLAASIGTSRGPVLRALVHAGMERLSPESPEAA